MGPPEQSRAERSEGVSILTAATPVIPAQATTRGADVYKRFRDNPDLIAIPVVDGQKPIGLVNRYDLTMSLAQDYGRALYAQKPITASMDAQPLIVDSSVTIDALEWMIAANRPAALNRGFIVVHEGAYFGVGTALTLLQLSIARSDERNRQLAEAHAAAEEANRSKVRFLATVSHELRTPLNAIIGFSDLMRQGVFGPVSPSRYHGYLDDIHTSAETLLALINDILDIAKIDSGKMQLFEETIDAGEPITAALRMLTPRARSGGVQLRAEIPRGLPGLHADQRAVNQILMNLLSNAIKFAPNGTVTASAEWDGDEIAIAVADTGIGMTPAEIDIALSPFGQVVKAQTRREGTGLGLPLVKNLAELHGARFMIASEPGAGTTVRIVFPRERIRHREPQPEPGEPALRLVAAE